jgi:hypothetical protein
MPLNETDKAWVRQEIQAAQKPGGLTGLIKEWSGTGAAVAILISFLLQWNGYTEFRTLTGVRLSNIEKNLEKLNGTIATVQLNQIAGNPTDPHNIQEAKRVLASARATNTNLDQNVIQATGKKFIEAAQSNPDAWQVALAFVNYRSSDPSLLAEIAEQAKHSARIRGDGLPCSVGPSWAFKNVIFDNCILRLNKALEPVQFHGVIFSNSTVIYEDGQFTFDRVAFINCTFQLPYNDPGKHAAETLLALNQEGPLHLP